MADKIVKVKFNFDTLIGDYQKTDARLPGGSIEKVDDFTRNDIAKRGEIREVNESMAKALMTDLIKVPIGNGKSVVQRMSLDDFMDDQFLPRAELVA